MGIEFSLLPKNIQNDLLERYDNRTANLKTFLDEAKPEAVLEEWLSYNGIIRWSNRILEAWNDILKAQRPSTVNDDVDKFLDITGAEIVEVVVGSRGNVLWVNTQFGTKLRICRISKLTIIDERPSKDQNLDS